jgi:hypothetical protein
MLWKKANSNDVNKLSFDSFSVYILIVIPAVFSHGIPLRSEKSCIAEYLGEVVVNSR